MAALRSFSADILLLLLGIALAQQETTTPDGPQTVMEEDSSTPILLNEDSSTPILLNEDSSTPILLNEMDDFTMTNPTHVNGEELYEADILLTPKQRQLLAERKAISSEVYRWPEGASGFPEVPFTFSDNEVNQAAVQAGIDHWEEHTCIRFVDVVDTNEPHLQFIKGSGCYSYVGMIFHWDGQDISIGSGCTGLGIVAHEIGHALGFYHEQSRSDRDDYVVIMRDNIQPGREGNFEKASDNDYSVEYDYSSDMHYGSLFFSNNGEPTIVTKDPLAQGLIGLQLGLSHRDILMANRMYSCLDKWLAACQLESDPCQNDGYIGADCNCVCPPGTEGVNCSSVTGGYYDDLYSDCTEKITEEGTVSIINAPVGTKCVKWIVAPTDCDYTIKLTFTEFSLHGMNPPCGSVDCCYFDCFQIRTESLYEGPEYCDAMISNGDVFTSTTGNLVLYYETSTSYCKWSADVEFIPAASCPDPPPEPDVDCNIENLDDGSYHWMSPNFGIGDYENDLSCDLLSSSEEPRWARVTINSFDTEGCDDLVTLNMPYDMEDEILCGSLVPSKIRLPTFNFDGTFVTNSDIVKSGFNITVTPETSNCHKVVIADTTDSKGTIKAPRRANNVWENKACEWWIQSPEDTNIRLKFKAMDLPCTNSALIVNYDGDSSYPEASSVKYCGETGTPLPDNVDSNGNKISILFYSTEDADNFRLRWKVR